MQPAPGALIADRYLLDRRLGRGGMAEVYAATDQVLHRKVAVKVFRAESGAEDRQRADSEIRTVAGLRHPGIVAVFDAGAVADGQPFIVMELVPGPTLARRLTDGPLAPALVATVGAQLAAALAHVHQAGIVHRDLKPANVLLDAPTVGAPLAAKLTDFGIARLVDSARLTMVGLTVGTANYLSPEQATGGAVGPASDVYSLGLVLLECLTGNVAYPGNGVEAAVARLHRPPEIPAALDEGWRALLTAMTAPEPAARPSAVQVYRQLAGAADTGPVDVPTAVLSGADSRPGSTRRLPAASSTATGAGSVASSYAGLPSSGNRSRVLLYAGAAAVLLVLVVVLVARGGSHSGGARPGPAPSYQSVPGTVGQHLRQLQGAVG